MFGVMEDLQCDRSRREENYEYTKYGFREGTGCFSRGTWNNLQRGYSPIGEGIPATKCSTASQAN
jgi:hypothetical protein